MHFFRTAAVVATGMAAAFAIGAAEAQTLDLKGTWKSTADTIVSGPGLHHPPGATARSAGPHRLRQQTFTFVVEGQDGKRFWGYSSSDHAAKVPFVGSLSPDGKWVYLAAGNGLIDGTVVDDDTLQTCYRQASPQTFMVGCSEWKRQK